MEKTSDTNDIYLELTEKYESLQKLYNSLIVRMSSVTHPELKEQLSEEAREIYSDMEILNIDIRNLNEIYKEMHKEKMLSDLLDIYDSKYSKCSLHDSYMKQGLDLNNSISKLKMRPFNSIANKKEICYLMNAINRQTQILDYQGLVLDTIGKFKDTNPFKIKIRAIKDIFIEEICVTPKT